jgi:hypothetical protein
MVQKHLVMTVIALVLSPCEYKVNRRQLHIIAYGPPLHLLVPDCTYLLIIKMSLVNGKWVHTQGN